jgi:hypothetical protein
MCPPAQSGRAKRLGPPFPQPRRPARRSGRVESPPHKQPTVQHSLLSKSSAHACRRGEGKVKGSKARSGHAHLDTALPAERPLSPRNISDRPYQRYRHCPYCHRSPAGACRSCRCCMGHRPDIATDVYTRRCSGWESGCPLCGRDRPRDIRLPQDKPCCPSELRLPRR